MKTLQRFIFESPPAKFIAIVWAVMLFKSGIGFTNFEVQAVMAEYPFFNPIVDPAFHYIFWTWLSPFLLWCLNITTEAGAFYFHLFFSIAFTLLFLHTAWRFLPEHLARLSFLIFAAMPVSNTAYFWVGTDSLTLFLMMASLALPFSKKSPLALVILTIGVLLGLQDFEKTIIAASALFATTYFNRGGGEWLYSPAFALTLIFGAFIGKFILLGVVAYFDITVNSGRIFWLQNNLPRALTFFFYNFQQSFYSGLGIAWLVAFYVILKMPYGKIFGAALVACLAVLLIAVDHTRVFALISFPLMAQFVLFNREVLGKITPQMATLFFVAWLILPFIWILQSSQVSLFSYDITLLFHHLLGIDLPIPSEIFTSNFVAWDWLW